MAPRPMNARKKKRLQARGWRVGSAAEFLGLSAEESALVEIRLALSRALRERRAARMTQAQLALRIGSSQPRIARAEGGDGSVSLDLLLRAILATGATPREIGRMIAKAAGTPVTGTAG